MKKFPVFVSVLFLAIVAGLMVDRAIFAAGASAPASTQSSPDGAGNSADWSKVHSFAYQLQSIDLEKIGRSHFDAIVIDYSPDGSDGRAFTAEQIQALQNSGNGTGAKKKVLAYLSIGEAEDYRFYWQPTWDKKNAGKLVAGKPVAANPAWLGPEDPDWHGNYKVKYWDPAWQAIVKQYVDKIIAANFDGIYLDIIDAYEFWGPDGESGLKRASSEQEMVDFVKELAHYARVEKHRPDFAIFPQNGAELGKHVDYLAVVTGIGQEDTWYDGNKKNKPADTRDNLMNLDLFKAAGKTVLVIDYVTQQPMIDDFYAKALAKGYIPYASVRALDKLTINAGHDPQ